MDTILCEKRDHEGMPKHYHLAGEFEARLQRLEEFKAKVEKAMGEVTLPAGFASEVEAAAKAVDA